MSHYCKHGSMLEADGLSAHCYDCMIEGLESRITYLEKAACATKTRNTPFLYNCPFCKAAAEFATHELGEYVRCVNIGCGAQTRFIHYAAPTRSYLSDLWNRR